MCALIEKISPLSRQAYPRGPLKRSHCGESVLAKPTILYRHRQPVNPHIPALRPSIVVKHSVSIIFDQIADSTPL